MIPTPGAGNYRHPYRDMDALKKRWQNHQIDLQDYVVMFPTPTVQDSKLRANPAQMRRKSPPLSAVVKFFPTPTCHDSKLARPNPNKTAQGSPCLTEVVLSSEPLNTGTLNPDWEEWLMGWPIGWTALKPLETAKFRLWLQGRLSPCNNN